ncbi:hypothetical protein JCM10207_001152 [Rhodosporidiobolus poonsookiae]
MATAAPPLPRRPTDTHDDVPSEPPPPYEPTPTGQTQTLELGPTRPFQPPPGPPPHHPTASASFSPPPQSPQATGLAPPQFPFWNGASLTPEQTGFSEGPVRPLDNPNPYPSPASSSSSPYAPPPGPPPQHPSLVYHHTGSSNTAPQIPPLQLPNPSVHPAAERDAREDYRPTETPTPGQPKLNGGRLLVYSVGAKPCWKCGNTGYKPFDPYSGYRGDDPNHPCRKCWQKHSRPFSGPLVTSCLSSTHSTIPANYQRPLRLLQTPATAPPRPQVTMTRGPMVVPTNPNAIVVRPGDPRMGGILCRRCGGDGLVMGAFIFDEETCGACGGAGRVFR